ncbi:MAG TPA: YbhB/YbcL family Raf kinase inhibitor-like protein [Actinomycetota bacterium]|jgi:Raf kinase inhibitor-like YbhB/YbcL family protein|nr:YbhB/YbcL family Raf kinase inhibitor-like protein [Actinomycetota bacterium]
MSMTLESTSVAHDQPIDTVHAVATPTADGKAELAGADRSPHLRWSGEPAGTRSFAISVVDPDVPADRSRMGVEGLPLGDDEVRIDFAHWLVVDLPSDVHELPEGAGGEGFVAHGRPPAATSMGGVQGQNGYRGLFEGNADLEGTYHGWNGPFPPWNDQRVHRYITTVYALDVETLGLEPGFDLDAFRAAIEGHVLASAEIVPTYTLNPSLR